MTVRVRSGGVTATLTGIDASTVRAIMGRAMGGALRVMESRAEELAAEARREWYGPNGVNRETGKSGDIQVVTTADLDRGEVRVGIGSTDDRTVQSYKSGNRARANSAQAARRRTEGGWALPVAVFVHQPSPNKLGAKAVDRDEWFRWRRSGLPTLPPPLAAFGAAKTGEAGARSAHARETSQAFWEGTYTDGTGRTRKRAEGLDPSRWYILATSEGTPIAGSAYLLQRLVKKPGKALAKEMAPEVARAIAQAVNGG